MGLSLTVNQVSMQKSFRYPHVMCTSLLIWHALADFHGNLVWAYVIGRRPIFVRVDIFTEFGVDIIPLELPATFLIPYGRH
jgi:hypothetical protein